MVRTLRYGPQDRPQASRIIGIAATIALHAAALMLLLIPLTAPRVSPRLDSPDKVIWVLPKEVPVTPVAPPIQTPVVQRIQPRTAPPLAPSVPVAVVDQAPFVDPAPTVIEAPGPVAAIEPVTGPVALSSLAYLKAPPPPYPSAEARSGVEGTVTLRILVGADGVPLEVAIEHGSGNRNLDRAAQRHVKDKWRFHPAVRNGQPVQAYGLVPIAFSLQ